jgi:hypothetical protein
VNGRAYTSAADLGLSAFDAANGAKIWPCPGTGRLGDTGSAAAMMDVLFVPQDGPVRVHQVRTTDGHINWSKQLITGQPRTFLTVWQGSVYCGTANRIFKLDASTGAIQKQLGGLPSIAHGNRIVPWQGALCLAAGPYVILIDAVQFLEVARYEFPGFAVKNFAIADSTLFVSTIASEDAIPQFLGAYPLPGLLK